MSTTHDAEADQILASLARINQLCDRNRAQKRAEPYRQPGSLVVPVGAWWVDSDDALEMRPIPKDQYVPIINPAVRKAVLYEQRMRRLQDMIHDYTRDSPMDGSAEGGPAEKHQ